MSGPLTQDNLLDNPSMVGKLMKSMMEGDDDGLTVTEAELSGVKADMEERKAAAKSAPSNFKADQFSPRGEGPSGQAQVPGLSVQSASVLEHDDDQGGSDEDPQFYDPDSANDHSRSGAGSAPLLVHSTVTTEDFDLLVDSVNTMLKDEISKLENRFQVDVGKLNLEVGALQKRVTSLSAQVTSLNVKLNERPPVLPITAATQGGPSTGGSSTAVPIKKLDKGKGREKLHQKQSPSVTDIPGNGPLVTTVVNFLAKNPVYPKGALARRIRLQQLAGDLGFTSPSKEVLPGDWTADGLLKAFT